jgi:putative hydrolase of the HAD superfamily
MDHPDWIELDRGTMTVDQAVIRGVARSGLSEEQVRGLIESAPRALVVKPDTVDLARRTKAAGNSLYCLSNMPSDSIEYLERRYDFWDVFDGMVISSRIGACKPDPAIYEHLLNTFHLEPARTVFIDDIAVNLEAAARFGIHTIQFTDVPQCEAELRRLGCLERASP